MHIGFLVVESGATHWGVFSGGAQALDTQASVVVTGRLNSYGPWALLPWGMWDLLGPGIEPMFPTLVGKFLTTGPPRKPFTNFIKCIKHLEHFLLKPVLTSCEVLYFSNCFFSHLLQVFLAYFPLSNKHVWDFPDSSVGKKNLPATQETPVQFLGWEDLLEKRKSYPLQYSGLEDSMECIACMQSFTYDLSNWPLLRFLASVLYLSLSFHIDVSLQVSSHRLVLYVLNAINAGLLLRLRKTIP